MRAVIVYESMFGNTRVIAEAIADGFGMETDVRVLGVSAADPQSVEDADVLAIAGPTHAWGMSRPSTRKGAPDRVRKPGSEITLEPGAT